MKTKSFFALLALGLLFSCQQNEQQEQSDEVINFSMSIDNDNLTTILARSGISNFYAGKMSFSKGDVVSLSASDRDFTSFTFGKDVQTWNEIASNSKEVSFYGHYPELPSYQVQSKRTIRGGSEYLFGIAEAMTGARSVALQFKRMTVPVIILDENENPYNGKAIIKLHLKNQGIQDLREGTITVDQNAQTEDIEIKHISEGFLTNLIPQTIKAGDKLGTITIEGRTESINVTSNFSMKAGRALKLKINYRGGVIIDGDVPLRK